MQAENQSEDSVLEQEDDEPQQSELEESFMDQCMENKQKKGGQNQYLIELPKPIQMMFILFTFYLDDLVSIGIDENCKVKLSLSKIKISSEVSQNSVQKCRAKIQNYLSKMSYTILDHDNKFKILYSPYFKQKAEQKGFRFCKFNNLVYCHSNKMQEKQLIMTMKNMFIGKYLFTVTIKSRRSKEQQIYNYFREFIRKMKEHYSKEFKQRQVVVELDNSNTVINCIGEKQRDLVAVKNQMKNLLQSTVILIVKFENSDQIDKKLLQIKTFIRKKCQFPVQTAKVEKRSLAIISKENVIRKLLEQNKFLEILKINDKTQLGMFMPRRPNFSQRKLIIQQICTKKGYDFTTLGTIYHYFKKMFIHEGEEVDPTELISLIIEILNVIKQNKDKFDIPQQIKDIKRQKRQIEITSGEYYSMGEIVQDLQLTKILKRNVLREKLRTSKPILVKFRVCDSPESQKIYWYENNEKQRIICAVEEMKLGVEYFCGKVKVLGNEKYFLYQDKIIIT